VVAKVMMDVVDADKAESLQKAYDVLHLLEHPVRDRTGDTEEQQQQQQTRVSYNVLCDAIDFAVRFDDLYLYQKLAGYHTPMPHHTKKFAILASNNGSVKMLEYFIQNEQEKTSKITLALKTLDVAIEHRQFEAVQYLGSVLLSLLVTKDDFEFASTSRIPPRLLKNAVDAGFLPTVRFLWENRIVYFSVDAKRIALNAAAYDGHLDITCYLMDQFSKEILAKKMKKPLFHKIVQQGNLAIVKLYVETYHYYPTLQSILIAMRAHQLQVFEYLLQNQFQSLSENEKADFFMDICDSHVHEIIHTGNVSFLKALVDCGMNMQDDYYFAFRYACARGEFTFVKYLLDEHHDKYHPETDRMNMICAKHYECVRFAVESKHYEIVIYLHQRIMNDISSCSSTSTSQESKDHSSYFHIMKTIIDQQDPWIGHLLVDIDYQQTVQICRILHEMFSAKHSTTRRKNIPHFVLMNIIARQLTVRMFAYQNNNVFLCNQQQEQLSRQRQERYYPTDDDDDDNTDDNNSVVDDDDEADE
jgi:hypothetical protein